MNLSLCCLWHGESRMKTMTYRQFRVMGRKDAISKLSLVVLNNFEYSLELIERCVTHGFAGYRFSSKIVPLVTHPDVNLELSNLPCYEQLLKVTKKIRQYGDRVRYSFHPSEYVSLTNPNCLESSISDLNLHGELAELFGFRGYWNPINIHIRKDGNPAELSEVFKANFKKLSGSVSKHLVLENNDNAKGTWSIENLSVCFRDFVPITFDSLHHSMLPGNLNELEAFRAAYKTWGGEIPLFHYSESRDGTRAHADLPTGIPPDYGVPVYWDIELKMKNLAIQKLYEIEKRIYG